MIRSMLVLLFVVGAFETSAIADTVRVTTTLPADPATLPLRADETFENLEGPLLPEHILRSSATRFPEILESIARERAASGDLLAADGAFDLVFKADGFDRATGFWTGAILNTELRQNLRSNGGQVYGGYRVSDGTFPIYEDINFTNNGGEFKVGVLFSLLRDRSFDQRRFRVEDARFAQRQASLDVILTQIGVQQQALNAYWRWVATGQELKIYRELLQIAENRNTGLEEQVSKGALPTIALTENMQNIIRRQILVAEAERSFAVAANSLSFYFRDSAGDLLTPDDQKLPEHSNMSDLASIDSILLSDPSSVLLNRPELASLRVAIQRAQNKVRLSKNDLQPNLDFNIELSRDLGRVAEGGLSRDSTDTVIGFKFSVPIQRRGARGRLQRAEAELRAARLRENRIADQISIELNNILISLTTALKLSTLATDEVTQSNAMVVAEQKKFDLGASDFFLVNIREERAADAEIRAIRAVLNWNLAKTSYQAATMNMPALGL